jgi:hypothetical protein
MTTENTVDMDADSKPAHRYGEKTLVRLIHNAMTNALNQVIDAGYYLKTAHDELFSETAAGQRTDTWKDWLHVNFGMTVGTASKYMQEHYSKPHVIEKKKSARAASNASG